MTVVWRELIMPLHLARVRLERDNRVREQVVHLASRGAIELRSWIPNGPVDQIEVRIVTASQPRWPTAGFPAFALPCVIAEFPWCRDCVEAPPPLAGRGVVGVEKASSGIFATGHTRDDHVFQHERRARNARSLHGVDHRRLPQRLTRSRIESYQHAIEGPDEDPVAKNRDTPRERVDFVRVHDLLLARPAPDLAPAACIDRCHRRGVSAASRVHYPVDDQRRTLHARSCRRESGTTRPPSTALHCSA